MGASGIVAPSVAAEARAGRSIDSVWSFQCNLAVCKTQKQTPIGIRYSKSGTFRMQIRGRPQKILG